MIPFWRIAARVRGMDLATPRDLLTLANLPGASGPVSDSPAGPVHFWTPAFKIRPRVFLNISCRLTLAQPAPPFEKKLLKNQLLPINLPAGEAVQSIKLILASLARPLKAHLPRLAASGIKSESATLCYLPFDPGAHEFTHEKLSLAINANVLKLSGNL